MDKQMQRKKRNKFPRKARGKTLRRLRRYESSIRIEDVVATLIGSFYRGNQALNVQNDNEPKIHNGAMTILALLAKISNPCLLMRLRVRTMNQYTRKAIQRQPRRVDQNANPQLGVQLIQTPKNNRHDQKKELFPMRTFQRSNCITLQPRLLANLCFSKLQIRE
jgi:hypothetical protein